MKKRLFTIILVFVTLSLFALGGGTGTEADPFQIANLADFNEMIACQDQLHAHWYFKFVADVDFNGQYWTNSSVELFSKVNGNGYKLKNLRITMNSNEEWVGGLFSAVKENAVLKNLTIELHPDGYIVSNIVTATSFSVLCCNNYGLIQNCSVVGTINAGRGDFGSIANQNLSVIDGCSCNITVNSQAGYVGGICAYNGEGAVIKDCNAQMTTTSGSDNVGGICAYNRGLLQKNTSNSSIHGWTYVGGICGKSEGNITGCVASGNISGYRYLGGIAGYVSAPFASDVLVENCYSSCNVTATGNNATLAGGLIGMTFPNFNQTYYPVINSCFSTGSVSSPMVEATGEEGTGGLIGRSDGGAIISNCYSNANVSAHRGGGLIGIFIGNFTARWSYIRNSYATGNVNANIAAGGFIDFLNYAVIENCYARGNVTIQNPPDDYYRPGGFISKNYQGKVKFCYSTGTVKNTLGENVANCAFVGYTEGGGLYQMYRNFYDKDAADNNTQQYDGFVATGKTSLEMKQQSTFSDWDFSQIWAINSSVNNGYPYLINSGVATLPVELSAFNAVAMSADFVSIQWTTQSESNLIGYHVYRSDDNVLSHTIRLTNSVIYAANSSTTQDYTFTDSEILPDQIYYYWLQSVESDGSSTYFGPVSVKTLTENPSENVPEITQILSVYPNPVKQNQMLHLLVDVKENDFAVIDIFNIKGQLLKTFNTCSSGSHNLVWDMKDNKGKKCATGIYFYRLSSPSVQQIQKIMILK
jgi:hypothetical protein